MELNNRNYDFSGYVTKNDLRCSDGRTIRKNAFKDNDGCVVPMVWQHVHDDPDNVLGKVLLQNRSDGVYGYGMFNNTPRGQSAKELVKHGDIQYMSIFANQLKQNGGDVIHGNIREVSLVLAGANPGAKIDNINFAHSDGSFTESEEEAIITTGMGIELRHAEDETKTDSDETVEDVWNTLSEKQKKVIYLVIGAAMEDKGSSAAQSDINGGDDEMKYNVFEGEQEHKSDTLTHDEFATIMEDAKKNGSLKNAFLEHAGEYGIKDINILFPDAKSVTPRPDFIKRDTDWVSDFMGRSSHSPFSRIKSTAADITADEARARGYTKGKKKVEEVIKLSKRVTTPQTIYKKQKLDRDDIIDITDFDVVSWVKSEMRIMLDEEIARAALIGDGREEISDDKIDEEHIRPIMNDDDLYSIKVDLETATAVADYPEHIIRAMNDYEGSGTPTLYASQNVITDMLLLKDTTGRRLYNTEAELAAAIGVSKIVAVPQFKGLTRKDSSEKLYDVIGIIVNPADYRFGADRGGSVSFFDDFDIDYNQNKYLLETRLSGALIHPKSAVVIDKKQAEE